MGGNVALQRGHILLRLTASVAAQRPRQHGLVVFFVQRHFSVSWGGGRGKDQRSVSQAGKARPRPFPAPSATRLTRAFEASRTLLLAG